MKVEWKDGEVLAKGDRVVPEVEYFEVLGEATPPKGADVQEHVYLRVRQVRLNARQKPKDEEVVLGVRRSQRFAVVK